MAAGRLVIPGFFPAEDTNGDPVSGAKMYVYQNETTTLSTVYAEEALTTPLTNPVVANSAGGWPAIWADGGADPGDTQYSVTIVGPTGRVFRAPNSFVDVTPSVDADTAAALLAEAAAEAAVAAADTAVAAAEEAVAGTAGKVDKSAFEAASGFVYQTGTTATDFQSRPFASEFDFIAYDDSKPLNSDVMKPVIDALAGKDLGNLDSDAGDNFMMQRPSGNQPRSTRTLHRDYIVFDELSGANINASTDPAAIAANNAAWTAAKGLAAASAYTKKIILRGQPASGPIGLLPDGVGIIAEQTRYSTAIVRATNGGSMVALGNAGFVEGFKIFNTPGLAAADGDRGIDILDVNGARVSNMHVLHQFECMRTQSTTLNIHGGIEIVDYTFQDPADGTVLPGSCGWRNAGMYQVSARGVYGSPTGLTATRPSYGIKQGGGNTHSISQFNVTDQGYALHCTPTGVEALDIHYISGCFDKNTTGDCVFLAPQAGATLRGFKLLDVETGNSEGGSGVVVDGTLGLVDTLTLRLEIFNNLNYGVHLNGGGAAVTASRGVQNVMISGFGGSCGIDTVYFDEYVKYLRAEMTLGVGMGFGVSGDYGFRGAVGADNYHVKLQGAGGVAGLHNLTDNGTTKRID